MSAQATALPAWRRRVAWGLPYVAAFFVLLSLIALLVVPFYVFRTTERLRAELTEVTSPAQRHLQRISLTLAEQASLSRAFLTRPGDREASRSRYLEVEEIQRRSLLEAQRSARLVGPHAEAGVRRLADDLGAWRRLHRSVLYGDLTPEQGLAALDEQDDLLAQTARSANDAFDIFLAESTRRRADIYRLGDAQALITALLAALALLSAATVLWLGKRGALLNSALAKEETSRREAAARAQVLTEVSHDLKSPLSVISLSVTSLQRLEPPADPRWNRALERISGASERMTRLIRELLDNARRDAGFALPGASDLVQLSPLLERCAHEASAARDDVTVRCELDAALPAVPADALRVEQAVLNLLGNAVRHSKPGGTVRLSAREVHEVADAVEIEVHDDGNGIPPDHLAHLFEPFWRPPGDEGPGTGLGLTIVKGVVDAHGGHIAVDSTPTTGTTVSFTLPRAAA